MRYNQQYKFAFIAAILLHISLVILLIVEHHDHSTFTQNMHQENNQNAAAQREVTVAKTIQAVSIDNQEVMQTVQRLQAERAHKNALEQNRQQALAKQAEQARLQRIQEQQHLAALKNEAAKLAIARQKQITEEQTRLKQLAQQKQAEEKRLAEIQQVQQNLKKQQQEEANKLAALKKKNAEELAHNQLAKAEQLKAELARKKQAAAQQAAIDAAKNAQIAGEVNKYKAMIISAISQRWILPEHADSSLSSQFRIRLAPNGSVLDVSLIRSSGDPILDRSAQSAIYKASPLPVPSDPTTFNLFRDISLTVRPESTRG